MSKIKRTKTRKRGYVIVEGQKYWVQGYSDEELKQNKEKKREEIQSAIDSKSGEMTVRKWGKEWLETYKADKVNPRQYKDLEGQLKNWIYPVIGKSQIKAVRQMHIQKIMDKMKGHSQSYIKKVYDTTNDLFRQALYNRYIIFNPVVGIKLPQAKKVNTRRSITDEERAVIESVAQSFNGGIFYLIMLYAGLRPGEVAALKWKHIDFDRKIIRIRDALKSDDAIADGESEYNGKTINATRDVFLSKKLEAALRTIECDEHPDSDDFIAHKRRKKKTQDKYGHHTKSSMRSMWEDFCLAMHVYMGGETTRTVMSYKGKDGNEIKYSVEEPIIDEEIKSLVAEDLVPYDLRHTFCTDLRKKGVPIEEAKDLMGHSDISLTARIYSHATVSSIENARLLFDSED